MELGWFLKALIATVLFVPIVFAVPFFNKSYGIIPEITLFWWLVGAGLGIYAWVHMTGKYNGFLPTSPELTIVVLGLVFGVAGNILFAQSMISAPNPGIPVAIVGANSLLAFVIAPTLARTFPKYFTTMEFSWHHFAGISLVVIGVGVIALKQ